VLWHRWLLGHQEKCLKYDCSLLGDLLRQVDLEQLLTFVDVVHKNVAVNLSVTLATANLDRF